MYENFYKLKQNPFSLTPDPQFVCMTGQHQEALSGLIYSVCARPGLTLLVGEVGTGKTTLLYTLLDFLQKRRYFTALCSNPLLSGEEFYDYLLATLQVPCSSTLKCQRWIALQKFLLNNRAAGRRSVLIVDEAQKLSVDLLEEIRLLTNLETPQEKLLQIIMAGQPELLHLFRQPELRQLKQRINYFCTLQPLSRQEVGEYVNHRLARAGLPAQSLFSGTVIEAVYEYTNGIPRLVNTLCDNALRAGFALQSPSITVPIIEEAAADLDLQPNAPRREPQSANRESGVGRRNEDLGSRAPQRGVKPANGAAIAVAAAPAPPLAPPAVVHADRRGPEAKQEPAMRIPLENYSARQKSLGFLAGILDLWR